MGSFFAGIKAGTLGGLVYVGGLAVFNVLLLYALQPEALKAISQSYPMQCPAVPNVNGSAADCFSSLVAVDVPFVAFVAFFVALLYGGIFGIYFDAIPTRSKTVKGLFMAAIVGGSLLFFGFAGYVFDSESAIATATMMAVWTSLFGFLFGRLYGRYTRQIEFSSQDPLLLKVMIDGRDLTGKSRTFAATSTHKVRAELTDDASFKEWESGGGVALEDSRSFDTVFEVTGDGVLKGIVGRKY